MTSEMACLSNRCHRVNYVLAANAGFTSSFTLSLLHIVLRPHLGLSVPNPNKARRLYLHRFLPVSIPVPTIQTLLSIVPLFFALPIPLLGLGLVLSYNPDNRQIIYFQGTYCNLDVYAFQFTCGMLAGLPLILSLVILSIAGWKVSGIRRAVKRNSSRSYKNRSFMETVEKDVIRNVQVELKLAVPHPIHVSASPPLPSPMATSPTAASMTVSNSNDHSHLHLMASDNPSNNPITYNLSNLHPHLRLATRFVLLAFMITISAVLFLLQVSLSGMSLVKALNVDKYWEGMFSVLSPMMFGWH